MGGFSIVKQGAHLSKPPEKSNTTKTQKSELMQELPKGCNNIFIMGDLQRGTLQTLSLPRKAFREASGHWSSPEPNQRPCLGLEQHHSSAAPEAQESRPQLLLDRFTCKYILQRGTRLVSRTNVENTTLH